MMRTSSRRSQAERCVDGVCHDPGMWPPTCSPRTSTTTTDASSNRAWSVGTRICWTCLASVSSVDCLGNLGVWRIGGGRRPPRPGFAARLQESWNHIATSPFTGYTEDIRATFVHSSSVPDSKKSSQVKSRPDRTAGGRAVCGVPRHAVRHAHDCGMIVEHVVVPLPVGSSICVFRVSRRYLVPRGVDSGYARWDRIARRCDDSPLR
jgi:hypothetical protein